MILPINQSWVFSHGPLYHDHYGVAMSLGSAQKEFVRDIADLIIWAYVQGYTLTFGDAYRDPRVHGEYGEERKSYASSKSEHKRRLAVDLNLFIDGHYQPTTEAHKPLGDRWKSMNPKNVWGGTS